MVKVIVFLLEELDGFKSIIKIEDDNPTDGEIAAAVIVKAAVPSALKRAKGTLKEQKELSKFIKKELKIHKRTAQNN